MTRLRAELGRVADRRAIRRWARAAAKAGDMALHDLQPLRGRASALRDRLDHLIRVADQRFAMPHPGAGSVERPLHSDWAWRPPLWSEPVSPPGFSAVEAGVRVAPETSLFHDCARSEITFRQVRRSEPSATAPFGARMDVFAFDGSFLSLALDLPPEGVIGLERRHLIRLTLRIALERPLEIFARLNIRHGPNTEQVVREFPMDGEEMMVEFDLAYTELNEKRIERAWLDLIFEGPEMNQIVIRDLTLARRPRAEL